MIQIYFFYFFAVMTILSAIFVVFANNPVHSVLWLITSFFGVAGLFILLGAEFLALILMIVYVGALAVLFLFVVMMLNISFDGLRTGIVQYLPFGLLIGMLILAELLLAGAIGEERGVDAAQSRVIARVSARADVYGPFVALCTVAAIVVEGLTV